MKTLFSLLLSLFIFQLNAQTLTQAFNEPKVGDVDTDWLLDTTAFTSGLPISITGTNCVWDFSKLTITSPLTTSYVSTSAVPSASTYVGCNIVEQTGNTYTFLKSVSTPTAQTELVGLDLGLGTVNFTNTGIGARYPMSYGFTLSDNVAGTFSSSIISTSGTSGGTITTSADGLGTLNLPDGSSLQNVLRVKNVLNLTLSVILPLATVKQTVISYYHSSQKFPILYLSYTNIKQTTSTTGSLTASVRGNGNVITSLPAISNVEVNAFRIYPNPSANNFTVMVNNFNNDACTLELYDCTSRLVHSSSLGNNSIIHENVDTQRLSKGLYFLAIKAGSRVYTQRVMIDY